MTTILLISRCPPYPLHLGDRLIIGNFAREFAKRGHTVDLIAYANQTSDAEEQHHYQAHFRHINLITEPPRTAWDYAQRILVPSRRFPTQANDSWSPEMWRTIEQHLADNQYDVVHVFGGIQVYEFYHLLKQHPNVITPYESYSLYLKRVIQKQGGVMNRLNQRIAQQFEQWMFTPYQRVVVLAQPDKDELLATQPHLNVEVIPNGIELDRFPFADTQRDPATLLFVGNYDYAPNVDAGEQLIHHIFPQVQHQIPTAKLQLVGNAPPIQWQQLNNPSIEVTGRVESVYPYLAKGTVFVCPLRFGAGLKNKVLEAMAVGIPIVATPLSVDGIDVKPDISAVVSDNDQLAEATITLLKDYKQQIQLAHNARQTIEQHYTWTSAAQKYENLYQSINFQTLS